LMEIVMFYGASGGSSYVGLNNRIVGELDLSSVLGLDKAILVGRFSESPVSLNIDGEPVEDNGVSDLTFVRMVIPITNRSIQGGNARN